MEVFNEYLSSIHNVEQRARVEKILHWVSGRFPTMEPRVAWNQPMFIDHGTFIIGFSVSKQHVAIAPEKAGMEHFTAEIEKSGYGQSTHLFRIKWSDTIDYSLLERIIAYNREDKSDYSAFWRK